MRLRAAFAKLPNADLDTALTSHKRSIKACASKELMRQPNCLLSSRSMVRIDQGKLKMNEATTKWSALGTARNAARSWGVPKAAALGSLEKAPLKVSPI